MLSSVFGFYFSWSSKRTATAG